ncbi:G patch domain-containing protein 4 [Hippocampus comes]|uniref:G patch domain-containing protein 4 n=1 Tax=Hippocampus comes TaxID=109280 RepID=UPI00094ED263|nr:PREDICTED: G patch domain-containing protein 4 [Hippocampus comes]XP_019734170.1 PREDICTED: G patch domain-containing protein 4 [Hippocampus comes]
MTDSVQDKGHGLRFAEQQLKRHGWKHGKGLGRDEKGISEAIKVKVKCNKGGVGHKEGEQFTFHWWDHAFNKASASLRVESHQNGISLKKMAEDDEEDGSVISNKKPRKASLAKAKLYGCFVKSATLLSGQEQPEPTVDSDGSSSDQEEDHKLDLSSATKLSDCELVKACGGRTAHKGARHGLNMSAKLARLEQQEADFMAKYGNKTEDRQEGNNPKNKRASKEMTEELNNSNISLSEPSDIRIKKKKKKRSDDREEAIGVENGHENHTKKQKKKNGQLTGPELDITPVLEKKKKKKKELQLPVVEEQMNHTESEPLVSEHQVKKKSKKSKKDSNMWEEPQASPPPKKKKSKE